MSEHWHICPFGAFGQGQIMTKQAHTAHAKSPAHSHSATPADKDPAKHATPAHGAPAHAAPSPAEVANAPTTAGSHPPATETAAAVAVAPPEAGPTAEPSPAGGNQQLIFSVVLTIAAAFPVATGVGVAFLKGSTSTARESVSADRPQKSNANESTRPMMPQLDREVGDRHFEERRFEVALGYYRSLGGNDPTRLPPELGYRVALCLEGLGRWENALEGFAVASEAAETPVLKVAASVAQARVLLRMHEPDRAGMLLRSLLFHSSALDSVPPELMREIEFLIPLTQTQDSLAGRKRSADGVAQFPVDDTFDWPLTLSLHWAEAPQVHHESTGDAHTSGTTDTSENAVIVQVHRPTSESADAASIESWTIDIRCRRQSFRSILDRMAVECGWTLDLTDVSNVRSLDRIVNLNVREFPLCSLLGSVGSELRSYWSVVEGRLTLVRTDSDSEGARQMLARSLTSTISHAPEHRLARHAKFAIYQLLQLDGRFQEAADGFKSLVCNDSSPLSVRAAYNAATNYFRMDDYSRACGQLEYVVAGSPEIELRTDALMLYGRLLLDTGDAPNAVFQFRRAAEPAGKQTIDQSRAAVLMGLSLLAQDKFYEAAEVILVYKTRFDDPSVRNGAAFVNAFARWQVLKDERQEREATFLYRALVSLKSDSDWLGLTGKVQIGRAFAEIGFEEEMAQIYAQIPRKNLTADVRHSIDLTLARYELNRGNPERACEVWKELASEPEDLWTNRARLKLVELAFAKGEYAECLVACRSLVDRVGIPSGEIKKLMGRTYEAMGDADRAARSYAGQIPAP